MMGWLINIKKRSIFLEMLYSLFKAKLLAIICLKKLEANIDEFIMDF